MPSKPDVTAECSCGARIIWIVTASGKSTPCEPGWHPGDGTTKLYVPTLPDGRHELTHLLDPEDVGRLPHHPRCPDAHKHRKTSSPKKRPRQRRAPIHQLHPGGQLKLDI